MPSRLCRSLACHVAAWTVLALAFGCSSGPRPTVGITQINPEPSSSASALRSTEPAAAPTSAPELAFSSPTPVAAPPVIADPAAITHATGIAPPSPLAPSAERTPASSASGSSTPALPNGVLPFSVWAPILSLGDMRVTKRAYPQTFEVKNDASLAAFTIGHPYARWNGLNVALGFAPVLLKGELALHSLDLSKNLYPLFHGRLVLPTGRRILVLDPGHGGRDAGSRCVGRNTWEKELTLDWARRIEKRLAGSGWQVVLTRPDDRDLSLLDRVAIADHHQADLFISLHFNSFVDAPGGQQESGLETYSLTPVGMPSSLKRGFEDDTRKVFANNRFDTENLILAARLHASLLNATGRKDRGLRRARFMTVLREQRRPAALLEGGFLSNPAEMALILQPEFREKMAEAVCQALPQ